MSIGSEKLDSARLALEAIQAVSSIFVASDTHDWADLRARLADRVTLDWTSLNGGEPAELSGDEVTKGWRSLLGGFDATHHQLGNFLVDEIDARHARLRFYGTATHVLAVAGQDDRWVLGGRYGAVLHNGHNGWRVTELTLSVVWGHGNQNLRAEAAARGKASANHLSAAD